MNSGLSAECAAELQGMSLMKWRSTKHVYYYVEKKLSQDLQSHSLKILMTKRAAIGQDYHDRVRSPDTKDESGPSEALSD
mgnify:CR=1 FL=1